MKSEIHCFHFFGQNTISRNKACDCFSFSENLHAEIIMKQINESAAIKNLLKNSTEVFEM
jgi:hypothetical protein